MRDTVIASEPLDLQRLLAVVHADGLGAVATFLGLVRDHNQGRKVMHLVYEAYEPLAEKALQRKIVAEAGEQWPSVRLAIHHRSPSARPASPSLPRRRIAPTPSRRAAMPSSVSSRSLHGGGEVRLTAPRLDVPYTHGTGCTFAAAIAARLASGDSLDEAARGAKEYVTGAMRHGIDVGSGHQPLGHFWQTR